MIRIGIVGPARRHNGTGPFVAKFLHDEGATIAAVCASTAESSCEAAAQLGSALGNSVNAFARMEDMLEGCDLDAVAICSPIQFHEAQLQLAARAGLHAFCEKPLIGMREPGMAASVTALAGIFRARDLVLHQNTQWTYILDDLAAVSGQAEVPEVRSFEMFLAPSAPGLSMFWEAVPHPASLLVALGASGVVSDVHTHYTQDLTGLNIEFQAHRRSGDSIAVVIALRSQVSQPRPCSITINQVRIDREVMSLFPYRLALRTKGTRREIQDPVQRSVEHFVRRITGGRSDDDDMLIRQFHMVEALWRKVSEHARIAHGDAD